jgi:SH3-like domain-containing protein
LDFGSITKVCAAAALCLLSACRGGGPPPAKPIGQAFVGPAQLKIRSDIPLQSPPVTTVKHGDKLEILQTRRKFYRVRGPDGKEGWTDERSLLAAPDMQALHDLAHRSAKLPNQGVAITYQPLNIHTQPAMSSPSFVQLKENDKVEVLQSVLLPRTDAPRTPIIPPAPKKTKAPPKKERKGRVPLPPPPKPPAPPADWVELSRHADEADEAATAQETPPVKTDGWSLVRTQAGQVGWVLTRLVSMGIPDEVAQYAEGRRIVSYFALAETPDGDQQKKTWLWTTTTDSHAPWDFDSFRIFIWSLKRHRYETTYIERNIKGYAPVLIKEVDYGGKGLAGRYPGFSICMDKKDGTRARRMFALIGQTVRLAGEQPCEPAPPPMSVPAPAPLPVVEAPTPVQAPKEGLFERLRKKFKK